MTTDWIEHDGSEWPKHAKPEDRVIVRLRDGVVTGEYRPMTVSFWAGPDPSGGNWSWVPESETACKEIIAYRVVPK